MFATHEEPIPVDDWEGDVREMLIYMMVREMGMEYGRAFTLTLVPSCTSAMAFTYARLARDRYGMKQRSGLSLPITGRIKAPEDNG